jgi:hypothetical protein
LQLLASSGRCPAAEGQTPTAANRIPAAMGPLLFYHLYR